MLYVMLYVMIYVNDPSAGSPTETLLRLHLPLSDEVYIIFYQITLHDIIIYIYL